MEKNYINWLGNTHFYLNIKERTYGVRVNKDEKDVGKIIKEVLEQNKDRINHWKLEWQQKEVVA